MGNVQQQFSNFVGNSPLRLMTEDTFLVVLKNLEVSDYVHLTMLCRNFNQIFGSNNFLWAQMIEDVDVDLVSYYDSDEDDEGKMVMDVLPNRSTNAARILLATSKGQKLMLGNAPLKYNDELNVRDKQLVSKFNFKEAIKKYYIHFIQCLALRTHCNRYTAGTTSSTNIEVREYDGQFKDVWAKADLKKHKCAQDFYYYVNFECSPKKLEQMKITQIDRALFSEIGGRLVVYQNSDVEPERIRFISRRPLSRIPKLLAPKPIMKKK